MASHFQLETSSANSFYWLGMDRHITLKELREFDMSDKKLVALSACNTRITMGNRGPKHCHFYEAILSA
ncbi:MAG: hypothetical protein NMNS02_06380 [Nitrosomonas sp.]|nr:MAG: hypothetical protein NMNS02_06380 [Nitrosomonas sp.]